MQIAMIGLGKMGLGLSKRLLAGGHEVIAMDLDPRAAAKASEAGAKLVSSMEKGILAMTSPRVVWLMLPSGAPTEQTLMAVSAYLQPGDILIDGGNSDYRDTLKRVPSLQAKGLHFIDCGTSGGLLGVAVRMACLDLLTRNVIANFDEDGSEGRDA